MNTSLIVILLAMLTSHAADATFESNQVRYLAPYDLFKTLNLLLPLSVQAKKDMPQHCLELSPANRAVLGDNQPTTGRPALSQPSGGFVRWYALCLTLYIEHSSREARRSYPSSSAAVAQLYGDELVTLMKEKYTKKDASSALDLAWNSLPVETQTAFLNYQLRHLIGPEAVVVSFGAVHSNRELTQAIASSLVPIQPLTVETALQKAIFFLAMRDEFLSY